MGKRCQRAPEHHTAWSVVKGAEETMWYQDFHSENLFWSRVIRECVIPYFYTYFFPTVN